MFICNYCNCVLKNEYETCPNCGGSSFKTKAFLGETIIETPPKGGYKIDVSNFKRKIRNANIAIVVGSILTFILTVMNLPFLILFSSAFFIAIVPFEAIIGLIVLFIGISEKRKTKKAMYKALKLSKEGILVKAMPYELINTGTYVAGKYYKCIMVKFKNSAGIEIPLYSETKFKNNINDDTVDLLIDPNDYSNYFIDYEIF